MTAQTDLQKAFDNLLAELKVYVKKEIEAQVKQKEQSSSPVSTNVDSSLASAKKETLTTSSLEATPSLEPDENSPDVIDTGMLSKSHPMPSIVDRMGSARKILSSVVEKRKLTRTEM